MKIPLLVAFYLITGSILFGQDSTDTKAGWRHYGRLGGAYAGDVTGGFGYYRLNRRTTFTFNDLRLFAYGLQQDAFVYLRYKSSSKKRPFPRVYTYNTLTYRKNTRAGVKVQYHYNQGLGFFLKDYIKGHITTEIGHAFDISDYLNDSRKTSYLKGGLYWDHDLPWFSTKFEAEYFHQISDINEVNLSRAQFLMELIIPVKNKLSININYDVENYSNAGTQNVSSLTFALGWRSPLGWNW